MTSKHTPGPWVVHDHPTDPFQYGHHVTTADGLTVCGVTYQLMTSTPYGAEESTRVANARLIAAAPELLEALEGFVSCWDACNSPLEFVSRARAAIAKVTGASPAPTVAPREEHPPCPVCFDTECNGECMENL